MKEISIAMKKDHPATVITLLVGLAGGGLARLLGFPASALLGSTLFVSAAALLGQPMRTPTWLRNIAFTVIGCSLGSGFTPDFLAHAALWPVSLLLLTLTLVLIMVCSSWILTRFFGHSWETAVLSSSPGGLSFAIALAESGAGDGRAISVIQSLRLLFIVLGLPPLLYLIGLNGGHPESGTKILLGHDQAIFLFLGAYLLGGVGSKRGVPAAYLVSGMILSGGLHGCGILSGIFPLYLLNMGFVITGSVIGSRFQGMTMGDLRHFMGAAMLSILGAIVFSAAAAFLISRYLAIPFGQVWVAYVPGGVEAMAAMAFSLGYDATFVATHHLFRILVLIVLLPLFLKMVRNHGTLR